MSRVYFHTPSDEAELRGSERAYASSVVNGVFLGQIAQHYISRDFLKSILPKNCYLHDARDDQTFENQFRVWASVGFSDTNFIIPKDDGTTQIVDVWTVMLNTALRMGNDQVKLFARIHAQCEIHPYIEGKNRAWLAGIIDRGLELGMYRPKQGWDEVSTLLKSRDDEPVVLSYSVCEQFPHSMYDSDFVRGEDGVDDEWYDLSIEERWNRCMKTLRGEGPKARPEISPETYQDYYFNCGTDLFTIQNAERAQYERNRPKSTL